MAPLFYWWISAEDVQNISSMNKQTLVLVLLAEINEPFPVGFELHGNYPNPFNPQQEFIFLWMHTIN